MNNQVYEVNLETKKQKNVTSGYNTERPVRFKAFLPEPGTRTNGGLWKVTFEKEGQEVLFQELGWEDETTREIRKVNLKRTQGSQAAQTSYQKGASVTICGLTDTANIHINGLSGTLDEFYEGHGSQPKGLWCRVILDNGQTIDVRPACLRHTPEFGDAGFYQNRAYLKDEYKAYVASTDTSDFLKMMFEKAKALPEWLTDHVDIIPPDFIKYLTLCQLNKDDIDRVRQNYEKLQSENRDRKIEVKLVCHGVCDTSTVAGEAKARTIRTHGFLRKFNNAGRTAWGPGIYVDERVRGTVGLYGKCGDTIHFFLCAAFQFNDFDIKHTRTSSYTVDYSERPITGTYASNWYVNISSDKKTLTFPTYANMSSEQSGCSGRRWRLCDPDGIFPLYEAKIKKKVFDRYIQKHWNKRNILELGGDQRITT